MVVTAMVVVRPYAAGRVEADGLDAAVECSCSVAIIQLVISGLFSGGCMAPTELTVGLGYDFVRCCWYDRGEAYRRYWSAVVVIGPKRVAQRLAREECVKERLEILYQREDTKSEIIERTLVYCMSTGMRTISMSRGLDTLDSRYDRSGRGISAPSSRYRQSTHWNSKHAVFRSGSVLSFSHHRMITHRS